ncbi:cyclic-phosphate processing receiver domain-containing protein [Vibrio sp. ArtGut-C1]|uniref:cyclic-phosphate processing receiver domain-containing protein n=1 Tax=Vibrio sp. ArtGut-C1 TaxID=2259137 RepID=UPI0013E054D4|nr:cyclic-phosphate processing receiver domain-containing protein [Vibrio sp. ArtGut-C1]
MKVYLDDERPTPKGWYRVYWPEEAIALLQVFLLVFGSAVKSERWLTKEKTFSLIVI